MHPSCWPNEPIHQRLLLILLFPCQSHCSLHTTHHQSPVTLLVPLLRWRRRRVILNTAIGIGVAGLHRHLLLVHLCAGHGHAWSHHAWVAIPAGIAHLSHHAQLSIAHIFLVLLFAPLTFLLAFALALLDFMNFAPERMVSVDLRQGLSYGPWVVTSQGWETIDSDMTGWRKHTFARSFPSTR